nr:aspartate/glutamate racemase family protein [Evansella clarkii]
MKTLGLIGGMSWESTLVYYKALNEQVKIHLGGLHSAECILYSVDFARIEAMQRSGKWEEAGEELADIARKLEKAGAEAVVLCTNTMHKVAFRMEETIAVPFLHLAQVTADRITGDSVGKVLLLGTKYTMEEDFFFNRLTAAGLDVYIPDKDEREEINRIIFQELCLGKIRESSQQKVRDIIKVYKEKYEIEAVILGCTELEQLFREGEEPGVRLYDTTEIHIKAAADFMLGG